MSFDAQLEGKKVVVSQVRSANGNTEQVHRSLHALGLGRIGKYRQFTLNAALWGMLRRVRHLVRVSEVK